MKSIPESWITTDLGSICETVKQIDPKTLFGSTFKYVDISSINSKFLRVTEAKEVHISEAPSRARQLIRNGDVVFSTVRTNLKRIALIGEGLDNQIASTGFAVLRPKPDVDSRYIFYYVSSQEFVDKVSLLQRGASYPAVRPSDVFSQKIPLAPLPEQKRIVAKLDKLFAHLDQIKARLERIPELLKQFRQAVLTQAVTGRLIRKEIALRQMRIEELTDFIGSGITPKGGKDNYLKEGVPFIRSMNVYPDGLHLEDIAFISEEMHDEMERTKVREGDVLLNITGASIGRATYVPVGFGEANVNQHVCILRCNKNVIPQFLSIYLNSKQGQSYIMETQTGMTRQGLNYSQIRAMQVPIVMVEDQREIVARVESLLLVADRIEVSYKALRDKIDQLPQTILSKAFRGELASAEKEVAGYSEEIGKLGVAAEP